MSLALWVNGHLQEDPAGLVLRADDRGFLLGDLAFETMRVQGGVPLRLEDHLSRLRAACQALHFPPVSTLPGPEDLATLIHQADLAGPGVLRLTVSRGPGARGLLPGAAQEPTVVAAVDGPPPPPPEAGLQLFRALPWVHPASPLAGHKIGDRSGALVQARAGAEGVVCDGERVLGGLAANLFLVLEEGLLVTPPAEGGVRAGVARECLVQQVAPRLGLDVVLRPVRWEEVLQAQEVCCTSMVRGVVAAAPRQQAAELAGVGWGSQVSRQLGEALEELLGGAAGSASGLT